MKEIISVKRINQILQSARMGMMNGMRTIPEVQERDARGIPKRNYN